MASNDTLAAIQRFLSTAQAPVVVEPGMEPIQLVPGAFEVMEAGGRLTLQAWTADRNFVRRITGVRTEGLACLELSCERFGQRTGSLQLLDTRRRMGEKLTRKAGRLTFREQFRRMLARQYPGWKIVELSSDPDLHHSLSGACTRACLRLGQTGVATIGVGPEGDADGALSAGLIWLDYLREREQRTAIEGLTLFVPAGAERTVCHRIRHLRRDAARFAVYSVRDGWEHPVDIDDAGNIETQLIDRTRIAAVPSWLRAVQEVGGVETVECGDGYSLRVNGLEFVRCTGSRTSFGIASRHPARETAAGEILALATELVAMRSPDSAMSRLGAAAPERWLESAIRQKITQIDAGLLPAPLYGQAPTIASGERGVVDLLAIGIDGRLTVVEVKASEDLNLPLQALDYWARVKWHLEQGDFTRSGYFSGIALNPKPPRMLLVAPALQFHPTTETILRFFPPELEVERIGVSSKWRRELKAVFRARGCEPVSCNLSE